MLGNFRKVFVEQPDYSANVPQGILDAISINLPAGYSYQTVGKGFCILQIPEGTKIKGYLHIDNSTKENLEKCHTFSDLLQYAINLQEDIVILPDNNGNYYLGDTPFSFDEIVKCPLKDMELKEGKIRYVPEKIAEDITILLEINGKVMPWKLKRVPYDSLDEMKFVNCGNAGFVLNIVTSIRNTKMTAYINTNISEAGSVKNAYDSIVLYNEFANGNVKIMGSQLNCTGEELLPYDAEAVEYWEQLLALEELFNVSFDVSKGIYDFEVVKVRELYRSLIEKKPFRIDETITNLKGTGEYQTSQEVDDMIGKEMYFRFLKNEEAIIMGTKLRYCGVKYVFGGKVSAFSYDTNTKAFNTEICVAEGQGMYTSTQYFLNEESLDMFLTEEDSSKQSFVEADLIPEIRALI